MKSKIILTAAMLSAVASPTSRAAVLQFSPPGQVVVVGSTVQIALSISGLGAGAAPSMGVFDLDLTFDSSILRFDSLTFGDPVLGDQLDLAGWGSVSAFDGTVPGVVNHFELSLDSPTDLDTLQASASTLSTFTFTALAVGTSGLDLVVNALGDALGDPLGVTISPGSVTVVPEPCAMAFVAGLGLCAFFFQDRRRRDGSAS